MKNIVVGLLGIAAVVGGLWNLGALWRLLGLPANPAASGGNLGLGFAVAFVLGIVGLVTWVTGLLILSMDVKPDRFGPEDAGRPMVLPPLPPRSQMTTPRPVPPENVMITR